MITIFSNIELKLTTNNAEYSITMGGSTRVETEDKRKLIITHRYYLKARKRFQEVAKKWEWIECWVTPHTENFGVSEIMEHIRKYEEKTFSYDEDEDYNDYED